MAVPWSCPISVYEHVFHLSKAEISGLSWHQQRGITLGERAVSLLGCSLPPAPCTGVRRRSASPRSVYLLNVFGTNLLTTSHGAEAAELFARLRNKSWLVSGLCFVQQARQLLKAQLTSTAPIKICPPQATPPPPPLLLPLPHGRTSPPPPRSPWQSPMNLQPSPSRSRPASQSAHEPGIHLVGNTYIHIYIYTHTHAHISQSCGSCSFTHPVVTIYTFYAAAVWK